MQRYGVFTLPLRSSKTYENPYLVNANVTVIFLGITGSATDRSFRAQGYWDGGQNYQVRIAPPMEGHTTPQVVPQRLVMLN